MEGRRRRDLDRNQRLSGEAEFGFAFRLFSGERRQGNTEEPDTLRDREKRFEQRVAEIFQLALRPDLNLTGAAARDELEVRELHLERDGAAANTGALAVSPHLVDDLP